MKKHYVMKIVLSRLILLSSFCFIAFFNPAFGSTDEVYMELTSWKYSDNSRVLVASLTAYDENGNEYLPEGANVTFFFLSEEEEILIGNGLSGPDGKAVLEMEQDLVIPMDEDGYMSFNAILESTDKLQMTEAELQIKDARLEIEFIEEDEERNIQYKGFVINGDGIEEPLMDDDCYLYVPRMFNLMKIEDCWLEEDGTGRMIFPTDLIGDTSGNVMIIARIEEHYDYGNLEASGNINWALSKHTEKREGPQRELWTPIAPMWMIITLIIMLAGVWGHYLYAVIQLYRVRQAGRNEA